MTDKLTGSHHITFTLVEVKMGNQGGADAKYASVSSHSCHSYYFLLLVLIPVTSHYFKGSLHRKGAGSRPIPSVIVTLNSNLLEKWPYTVVNCHPQSRTVVTATTRCGLWSSATMDYVMPWTHSKFDEWAYAGPTGWNHLPQLICCQSSLHSCKL